MLEVVGYLAILAFLLIFMVGSAGFVLEYGSYMVSNMVNREYTFGEGLFLGCLLFVVVVSGYVIL